MASDDVDDDDDDDDENQDDEKSEGDPGSKGLSRITGSKSNRFDGDNEAKGTTEISKNIEKTKNESGETTQNESEKAEGDPLRSIHGSQLSVNDIEGSKELSDKVGGGTDGGKENTQQSGADPETALQESQLSGSGVGLSGKTGSGTKGTKGLSQKTGEDPESSLQQSDLSASGTKELSGEPGTGTKGTKVSQKTGADPETALQESQLSGSGVGLSGKTGSGTKGTKGLSQKTGADPESSLQQSDLSASGTKELSEEPGSGTKGTKVSQKTGADPETALQESQLSGSGVGLSGKTGSGTKGTKGLSQKTGADPGSSLQQSDLSASGTEELSGEPGTGTKGTKVSQKTGADPETALQESQLSGSGVGLSGKTGSGTKGTKGLSQKTGADPGSSLQQSDLSASGTKELSGEPGTGTKGTKVSQKTGADPETALQESQLSGSGVGLSGKTGSGTKGTKGLSQKTGADPESSLQQSDLSASGTKELSEEPGSGTKGTKVSQKTGADPETALQESQLSGSGVGLSGKTGSGTKGTKGLSQKTGADPGSSLQQSDLSASGTEELSGEPGTGTKGTKVSQKTGADPETALQESQLSGSGVGLSGKTGSGTKGTKGLSQKTGADPGSSLQQSDLSASGTEELSGEPGTGTKGTKVSQKTGADPETALQESQLSGSGVGLSGKTSSGTKGTKGLSQKTGADPESLLQQSDLSASGTKELSGEPGTGTKGTKVSQKTGVDPETALQGSDLSGSDGKTGSSTKGTKVLSQKTGADPENSLQQSNLSANGAKKLSDENGSSTKGLKPSQKTGADPESSFQESYVSSSGGKGSSGKTGSGTKGTNGLEQATTADSGNSIQQSDLNASGSKELADETGNGTRGTKDVPDKLVADPESSLQESDLSASEEGLSGKTGSGTKGTKGLSQKTGANPPSLLQESKRGASNTKGLSGRTGSGTNGTNGKSQKMGSDPESSIHDSQASGSAVQSKTGVSESDQRSANRTKNVSKQTGNVSHRISDDASLTELSATEFSGDTASEFDEVDENLATLGSAKSVSKSRKTNQTKSRSRYGDGSHVEPPKISIDHSRSISEGTTAKSRKRPTSKRKTGRSDVDNQSGSTSNLSGFQEDSSRSVPSSSRSQKTSSKSGSIDTKSKVSSSKGKSKTASGSVGTKSKTKANKSKSRPQTDEFEVISGDGSSISESNDEFTEISGGEDDLSIASGLSKSSKKSASKSKNGKPKSAGAKSKTKSRTMRPAGSKGLTLHSKSQKSGTRVSKTSSIQGSQNEDGSMSFSSASRKKPSSKSRRGDTNRGNIKQPMMTKSQEAALLTETSNSESEDKFQSQTGRTQSMDTEAKPKQTSKMSGTIGSMLSGSINTGKTASLVHSRGAHGSTDNSVNQRSDISASVVHSRGTHRHSGVTEADDDLEDSAAKSKSALSKSMGTAGKSRTDTGGSRSKPSGKSGSKLSAEDNQTSPSYGTLTEAVTKGSKRTEGLDEDAEVDEDLSGDAFADGKSGAGFSKSKTTEGKNGTAASMPGSKPSGTQGSNVSASVVHSRGTYGQSGVTENDDLGEEGSSAAKSKSALSKSMGTAGKSRTDTGGSRTKPSGKSGPELSVEDNQTSTSYGTPTEKVTNGSKRTEGLDEDAEVDEDLSGDGFTDGKSGAGFSKSKTTEGKNGTAVSKPGSKPSGTQGSNVSASVVHSRGTYGQSGVTENDDLGEEGSSAAKSKSALSKSMGTAGKSRTDTGGSRTKPSGKSGPELSVEDNQTSTSYGTPTEKVANGSKRTEGLDEDAEVDEDLSGDGFTDGKSGAGFSKSKTTEGKNGTAVSKPGSKPSGTQGSNVSASVVHSRGTYGQSGVTENDDLGQEGSSAAKSKSALSKSLGTAGKSKTDTAGSRSKPSGKGGPELSVEDNQTSTSYGTLTETVTKGSKRTEGLDEDAEVDEDLSGDGFTDGKSGAGFSKSKTSEGKNGTAVSKPGSKPSGTQGSNVSASVVHSRGTYGQSGVTENNDIGEEGSSAEKSKSALSKSLGTAGKSRTDTGGSRSKPSGKIGPELSVEDNQTSTSYGTLTETVTKGSKRTEGLDEDAEVDEDLSGDGFTDGKKGAGFSKSKTTEGKNGTAASMPGSKPSGTQDSNVSASIVHSRGTYGQSGVTENNDIGEEGSSAAKSKSALSKSLGTAGKSRTDTGGSRSKPSGKIGPELSVEDNRTSTSYGTLTETVTKGSKRTEGLDEDAEVDEDLSGDGFTDGKSGAGFSKSKTTEGKNGTAASMPGSKPSGTQGSNVSASVVHSRGTYGQSGVTENDDLGEEGISTAKSKSAFSKSMGTARKSRSDTGGSRSKPSGKSGSKLSAEDNQTSPSYGTLTETVTKGSKRTEGLDEDAEVDEDLSGDGFTDGKSGAGFSKSKRTEEKNGTAVSMPGSKPSGTQGSNVSASVVHSRGTYGQSGVTENDLGEEGISAAKSKSALSKSMVTAGKSRTDTGGSRSKPSGKSGSKLSAEDNQTSPSYGTLTETVTKGSKRTEGLDEDAEVDKDLSGDGFTDGKSGAGFSKSKRTEEKNGTAVSMPGSKASGTQGSNVSASVVHSRGTYGQSGVTENDELGDEGISAAKSKSALSKSMGTAGKSRTDTGGSRSKPSGKSGSKLSAEDNQTSPSYGTLTETVTKGSKRTEGLDEDAEVDEDLSGDGFTDGKSGAGFSKSKRTEEKNGTAVSMPGSKASGTQGSKVSASVVHSRGTYGQSGVTENDDLGDEGISAAKSKSALSKSMGTAGKSRTDTGGSRSKPSGKSGSKLSAEDNQTSPSYGTLTETVTKGSKRTEGLDEDAEVDEDLSGDGFTDGKSGAGFSKSKRTEEKNGTAVSMPGSKASGTQGSKVSASVVHSRGTYGQSGVTENDDLGDEGISAAKSKSALSKSMGTAGKSRTDTGGSRSKPSGKSGSKLSAEDNQTSPSYGTLTETVTKGSKRTEGLDEDAEVDEDLSGDGFTDGKSGAGFSKSERTEEKNGTAVSMPGSKASGTQGSKVSASVVHSRGTYGQSGVTENDDLGEEGISAAKSRSALSKSMGTAGKNRTDTGGSRSKPSGKSGSKLSAEDNQTSTSYGTLTETVTKGSKRMEGLDEDAEVDEDLSGDGFTDGKSGAGFSKSKRTEEKNGTAVSMPGSKPSGTQGSNVSASVVHSRGTYGQSGVTENDELGDEGISAAKSKSALSKSMGTAGKSRTDTGGSRSKPSGKSGSKLSAEDNQTSPSYGTLTETVTKGSKRTEGLDEDAEVDEDLSGDGFTDGKSGAGFSKSKRTEEKNGTAVSMPGSKASGTQGSNVSASVVHSRGTYGQSGVTGNDDLGDEGISAAKSKAALSKSMGTAGKSRTDTGGSRSKPSGKSGSKLSAEDNQTSPSYGTLTETVTKGSKRTEGLDEDAEVDEDLSGDGFTDGKSGAGFSKSKRTEEKNGTAVSMPGSKPSGTQGSNVSASVVHSRGTYGQSGVTENDDLGEEGISAAKSKSALSKSMGTAGKSRTDTGGSRSKPSGKIGSKLSAEDNQTSPSYGTLTETVTKGSKRMEGLDEDADVDEDVVGDGFTDGKSEAGFTKSKGTEEKSGAAVSMPGSTYSDTQGSNVSVSVVHSRGMYEQNGVTYADNDDDVDGAEEISGAKSKTGTLGVGVGSRVSSRKSHKTSHASEVKSHGSFETTNSTDNSDLIQPTKSQLSDSKSRSLTAGKPLHSKSEVSGSGKVGGTETGTQENDEKSDSVERESQKDGSITFGSLSQKVGSHQAGQSDVSQEEGSQNTDADGNRTGVDSQSGEREKSFGSQGEKSKSQATESAISARTSLKDEETGKEFEVQLGSKGTLGVKSLTSEDQQDPEAEGSKVMSLKPSDDGRSKSSRSSKRSRGRSSRRSKRSGTKGGSRDVSQGEDDGEKSQGQSADDEQKASTKEDDHFGDNENKTGVEINNEEGSETDGDGPNSMINRFTDGRALKSKTGSKKETGASSLKQSSAELSDSEVSSFGRKKGPGSKSTKGSKKSELARKSGLETPDDEEPVGDPGNLSSEIDLPPKDDSKWPKTEPTLPPTEFGKRYENLANKDERPGGGKQQFNFDDQMKSTKSCMHSLEQLRSQHEQMLNGLQQSKQLQQDEAE